MASIKFCGSRESKGEHKTIQVFDTHTKEIFISLDAIDRCEVIILDVSTAIQFSKQLRKSIANAKNVGNE